MWIDLLCWDFSFITTEQKNGESQGEKCYTPNYDVRFFIYHNRTKNGESQGEKCYTPNYDVYFLLLKAKPEGSTSLVCVSESKKECLLVYYETIKWELKIKHNSECRCNERLKTKDEESTILSDTGLYGELEHLKVKTRLIDEKFASVIGECVI
jgi:hypothetical protein